MLLAGVASQGAVDNFTQYTNVKEYYTWIFSNIKEEYKFYLDGKVFESSDFKSLFSLSRSSTHNFVVKKNNKIDFPYSVGLEVWNLVDGRKAGIVNGVASLKKFGGRYEVKINTKDKINKEYYAQIYSMDERGNYLYSIGLNFKISDSPFYLKFTNLDKVSHVSLNQYSVLDFPILTNDPNAIISLNGPDWIKLNRHPSGYYAEGSALSPGNYDYILKATSLKYGQTIHKNIRVNVKPYFPSNQVDSIKINDYDIRHIQNLFHFPPGYSSSFGGLNMVLIPKNGDMDYLDIEFNILNIRNESGELIQFNRGEFIKIIQAMKFSGGVRAISVKVADEVSGNFTFDVQVKVYQHKTGGQEKEYELYSKTFEGSINKNNDVPTNFVIGSAEKRRMSNSQPPYFELYSNTGKPAPSHDPCNGQGQMPDGSCNASKYWKPGDKITFASWGPIGSNDRHVNDLLSDDIENLKITTDPKRSDWWSPPSPELNYEYRGNVFGDTPKINYPNDFDSFRFYVHEKSDVRIRAGGWGTTTPDAKMNVTTDDGYLIGHCGRSQWPIHSSYSLKSAKALKLAVYWNSCYISHAKPGYYRIWVTAKTPGRIPVHITYMPHSAWEKLVKKYHWNEYYEKKLAQIKAMTHTPPTNQTWIVDGVNGAYDSSWLTSVMSGIDD